MNGRIIAKYISESIIGMIGISIYILADTFFISMGFGADGLAVLNMTLPLYGLVYAVGSMIGVGFATVYSIRKPLHQDVSGCFTQSILWSLIFSLPFVLMGVLFPSQVLSLMGADPELCSLGQGYVRIILTASPLFMCNYTFTGFCRNDRAPLTAMIGSIAGSAFNIVFDYVFMFPAGLGFSGAALATACCPIVTMSICATHFLGKNNQVPFAWQHPSLRMLGRAASLGMSAFVGEISNGITSLVFNTLMLNLGGNIAVASYGVVANIALVCTSIFNGSAQGVQPLISTAYGQGKLKEVRRLLGIGLLVTLSFAFIFIATAYLKTDTLVGIFNSEHNARLLALAHTGLRLYFLGFLVSGVNIALISCFSAIGKGKAVVTGSLLRGLILNTVFAFLLSRLFGMNGVWLSYLTAEFVSFLVLLWMGARIRRKE